MNGRRCGVVMLAALAVGFVGAALGCTRVGSRSLQDAAKVEHENGAPNTLSMVDKAGTWASNGTLASHFTDMTAEGVQTFRQGPAREVFYDRDTGRFVISSDTDISAENVTYDTKAGLMKIGRFSTGVSEPIRAGNEGLAIWSEYLAKLAAMSAEARKAEVDAIRAVSEDAFAAVSAGLKLLGVP